MNAASSFVGRHTLLRLDLVGVGCQKICSKEINRHFSTDAEVRELSLVRSNRLFLRMNHVCGCLNHHTSSANSVSAFTRVRNSRIREQIPAVSIQPHQSNILSDSEPIKSSDY